MANTVRKNFILEVTNNGLDFSYVFPLNPETVSASSQNRVGIQFGYESEIYQNLGRGAKTISIAGTTGYSANALDTTPPTMHQAAVSTGKGGKVAIVSLYDLVQALSGKDSFGKFSGNPRYNIKDFAKTTSVRLVDLDFNVAYDVIIVNSRFFRSKQSPHLYRYELSFLVVNEEVRIDLFDFFVDAATTIWTTIKQGLSDARKMLAKVKLAIAQFPSNIPGVSDVMNAIQQVNNVMDDCSDIANLANQKFNYVTKLQFLNDTVSSLTNLISSTGKLIASLESSWESENAIQTAAMFGMLVDTKNLQKSLQSMKDQITASIKEAEFNVAVESAMAGPPSKTYDAAIWFDSTINDFSTSANYDIPTAIVEFEKSSFDYDSNGNAYFTDNYLLAFSEPLANRGVTSFRAFLSSDYDKKVSIVKKIDDTVYSVVLPKNYNGSLSFNVVYGDSNVGVASNKFRSIKKIKIREEEQFDDLLNQYCSDELKEYSNYSEIVAQLNNIESPYIVSTASEVVSYEGSYASTAVKTGSFKYDNMFGLVGLSSATKNRSFSGISGVSSNAFKLEDSVGYSTVASHFVPILIKCVANDKLYVLIVSSNASTIKPFADDHPSVPERFYTLMAVEKGDKYNLEVESEFEILNPYNLSLQNLLEYDHKTYFDSLSGDVYDKNVAVINSIYKRFVYDYTDIWATDYFAWLQGTDDQLFIGGTDLDDIGSPSETAGLTITNFVVSSGTTTIDKMISSKKYRVKFAGDDLLLPMLSDAYMTFSQVLYYEDSYKTDLDDEFDSHYIYVYDENDKSAFFDLTLKSGIANVHQAITNRLECPVGGLKSHKEYGIPDLVGRKNTSDNTTLLRYYLLSQLNLENRIKSVDSIVAETGNKSGDTFSADISLTLINNDETAIKV